MKFTRNDLKRIIKEELNKLQEAQQPFVEEFFLVKNGFPTAKPTLKFVFKFYPGGAPQIDLYDDKKPLDWEDFAEPLINKNPAAYENIQNMAKSRYDQFYMKNM